MKKFLVLILGAILLFSGCDSKKNNTHEEEKEAIKIGMLLPLTGNGALYGKYVKDGALLAISEINTTAFQVIIEDTKTTAKDGIFSINKLILKDNIAIVAGPMSSSVANTVGKVCQEKKVVMITTGSAPSISNLGDYIYRIYPSDSYDGSFLAEQIMNQKLSKSVVIYLNNDFGVGMVGVFEKTYKKQGGTIVDTISFAPNQQDFSVIVSKLKEYDLDNIFIVATQKEYINIINKMENLNMLNIPIFAPVNIEDKIVKEAISQVMISNVQYSKPIFDLEKNPTDIQNNFKSLWGIENKEKANIFNAYGYDLIHLINNILIDTKDKNYKATLDKYNKINGATGTYRFDENGDVVRNFSLLKLKDL